MGGTFDPVHHGHLIVARSVAEQGGFGQVLLVPAATPPHKNPAVATPQQRLDMLRLAVEGEDGLGICDLELHRTGPSYTLETILELRRLHGSDVGLSWVVGADMLADLPLWHRVDDLLQVADLVVVARPPWQEKLPEVFAALEGRLAAAHLAKIKEVVFQTPLLDISSTEIRSRIRQGRSIRYLVPEPVRAYIERTALYR